MQTPTSVYAINTDKRAFTLIELSIVLVIIGLIVGGILTGRDLIGASQATAQISQITKFRQAANTFREKYSFLPGDMPPATADSFGFTERCCTVQHGNGDGVVTTGGQKVNGSEAGVFWWDISRANLIEDGVSDMGDGNCCYSTYNPKAKVTESLVFVMGGGIGDVSGDLATGHGTNGINYFVMMDNKFTIWSDLVIHPTVSVKLAYAIDRKMDDGLPQGGGVIAAMWNKTTAPGCCPVFGWAGDNINNLSTGHNADPTTTATPGSSTTCYDNGNVDGYVQQYSISQNAGSGVNCGLAFKF